ncbi:MAG TPA: hypothetical protein PLL78_05150 [Fimbriimonadaceae bacterium]|nr:hypothetical protein [Fimbriimonadaceae bacterium]HRJ96052.1 hypothetical protein [Fimbriimonadaceae bacterium]
MTESLRLLLEGVIDYAGLFPPASLSMEKAIEEYRSTLEGPEAWLVDRFVCPISRLEEMCAILRATPPGEPWRISALGSDLASFRAEFQTIEGLEAASGSLIEVEAFEAKAGGLVDSSAVRHLANAGFDDAYIEIALGDAMLDDLMVLAQAETVGAKVRTGGVEPSEVPTPSDLAVFMQECINLDLTFKMTAGLHHPNRRTDARTGVTMHGFLNVLVAGSLAYVHDLSRAEIEKIVASEDPSDFWFSPGGLGWRDFEASNEEIGDFRDLFRSFGSCSVREPVDDLAELGLLAARAGR